MSLLEETALFVVPPIKITLHRGHTAEVIAPRPIIARLAIVEQEIMDIINRIENMKARAVLSKHYLGFKSWSDIADEMQMIFVTPYALNSWYFDSPVNKDFMYETFITKELVPWIDAHFPTLADRNHRAVTGLSMGGHGALFLSSRHIDLFGAAASMSGGVDIRLFPLNWNIPDVLGEMASNRKSWDEHSVMECVKQLKNGDVAIAFDCGESDFFIEVNRALHARLLSLGIDHDFTTRPGGHTDQYWSNSLDYQLLFFKKFFNK